MKKIIPILFVVFLCYFYLNKEQTNLFMKNKRENILFFSKDGKMKFEYIQ